MPLREFSIGRVGEELFPKLVAGLAEAFDDPARDRNVVVRDALAQLYLGREIAHDEVVRDPKTPPAIRALVATFDPRNATMEAEYYREIDLEKWARVKPLLWFWQMFDHSPVGRNVRLGTQMRYMLAKRIFKRCGEKVRIFHEVELSFGYNLTVGNGVTIHRNVLIDDRGEVIAPFTLANCGAVRADKTLQAVTWKGADDLSAVTGKTVKFRFALKSARLFAFWVSPEKSGASLGYVAAGGPGFSRLVDTVGGQKS